MKIYNSLSENKNVSLALGFFDGVHIAHKQLIQKAVETAHKNNLKAVVLTFSESPSSIISKKNTQYLFPIEDKIEQIEAIGTDYLYILDFNDFKNMEAETYLNDVILKYFAPKYVITGFNHTFGLNKKGNSHLLEQYKEFEYIKINPIKILNTLCSSTNIKNKIKSGDIEFANKLLGRNFAYKGIVVKGAQIARQIGYKTANLIWDKNIVKPKYGVYSGFVEFKRMKYRALINFGLRPTVDKDLKETLEAHIINFNKDIYGQTIKVEFLNKLRDEIKFSSLDELKTQIALDYSKIKA